MTQFEIGNLVRYTNNMYGGSHPGLYGIIINLVAVGDVLDCGNTVADGEQVYEIYWSDGELFKEALVNLILIGD